MNPNTYITLRQGMSEFIQHYGHEESFQQEGLSPEAEDFFRAHDIAHVLFDCDTSLFGEGSVKIWTLFGTDLGFKGHIQGYRAARAFQLSQHFSSAHSVRSFFRLMVTIPSLLIRAGRMKKQWPWLGYGPYLDRSLKDIRQEFNIQV